jgi:filamentous hemagglutinin family protein
MLLGPLAASAEVATDGTLGAKVRLAGRDVKIPARHGQRPGHGRNLFHSFERFGVEAGQTVTFTAPERLKLKNVIGRVTGRTPSRIDGTLASTIKGADLWLLNPAGILFGPDAKLDVKGSFHASTADELRFKDGKVFSALDRSSRVLSVAPPQAFGFLGAKPAGITVDRSMMLQVGKGKTLSLVGGDIEVAGGRLEAPAGTVALAAAGAAGAVRPGGDAPVPGGAGIRLTEGALVATSGDGGGRILLRGGRIMLDGRSSLEATNNGIAKPIGDKAGITVAARSLSISASSSIAADARGTGDAGPVTIRADVLKVRDDSRISSATFGAGNAGSVEVDAGQLLIDGEGGGEPQIYTSTYSFSSEAGDAGDLTVRAGTIDLRGGNISSDALFGSGNAGSVMVTADTIRLRDGGRISTNVSGSGNAGRVTVIATSTVELRDLGTISSTSGEDAGHAGEVLVRAERLLIDGGYATATGIFSDTGGPGHAGRVTVDAGAIDLRRGRISSNTLGRGAAGMVTVVGDDLELRKDGQISSATYSPGNAGEVVVSAKQLLLVDGDGALLHRHL